MIVYEIGKSYPHKDHRPGFDEIRAATDHSFFHITYYCTRPEMDSPDWRQGPMAYGLFTQRDIPFFLVHFLKSGLAFEVTVNIHTIADDQVEGWLNSDRTLVPMLLMDARTNIIQSMRMLSLNPTVAVRLRDCLEKQDSRYADAATVELATDEVLSRMTTRQMLKEATMHKV